MWLVRNASGLLIRCVSKCSAGSQGCRIPAELPALLDVTLGIYSVAGMTLFFFFVIQLQLMQYRETGLKYWQICSCTIFY